VIAASLLSFREGLEGALIVGILLAILAKTGQGYRKADVWVGVFGAVIVSVLFALLLFGMGAELKGRPEQIFEGITMLLAAGILTFMIFWMQGRGGGVKRDLESGIREATSSQGRWGVLLLAFVVVAREGIELSLFLVAALFGSSALETVSGAVVGLAAAVVAGLLVFVGARRLDLRRFFSITGIVLLFVAAGMVGRSVQEFQEASILPGLIEHLWTTQSLLNDGSVAGSVLKALFGYTDAPSLSQVLAYVSYLLVVLSVVVLRRRRSAKPADQPA
jgi:high-affinity iron transporter